MNSKTITFILVIFLSGAFAMIWHVKHLQQITALDQTLSKAQLIADTLIELRKLYSSDVLTTTQHHGITARHDYKAPESVPLPLNLSLLLGRQLSRKQLNNARFSVYSPYQFHANNQSNNKDPFSTSAWNALSKGSEKTYYQVDHSRQPAVVQFAIAEYMHKSCLECRNSLPHESKSDWQPGNMAAIIKIDMPVSILAARHSENFKFTVLAYTIVLLCGFSGIIFMIIKHKKFNDELERLTASDPLTGLYNQIELFTSLNRETEKIRRGAPSLCLITFNIDEFESINNTLGHIKGNEILRRIGDVLPSLIRAFDIPCRYAGDEFCIILPGCSIADAKTIAERIIETLQSAPGKIHLSVGIAQADAEHPLDSNQLFNLSREKMIQAKNTKGSKIST